MMNGIATLAIAVALASSMAASREVPAASKQWPQWRGPLRTGVAPAGNPPLTWSENENVRWKTPIPGKGHSTPVVWDDLVFLTTAIAHGDTVPPKAGHAQGAHDNVQPQTRYEFAVVAIARDTGSIAWQKIVHEGQPHDTTHGSGTWASASAVTDGRHVIASFGSSGLYGLTVAGELLWQKDLGDMQILHGHGEGSSPALHGDTVLVNWDHEGGSFLVALDVRTGEERWRVDRDEKTSWSSPLVVEHDGKAQVVVAATNRVRGYDLTSGKPIWECKGLSGNVVATPVAADGVVYVANSYETRNMLAIRLDRAKGDVTGGDAVLWTRDRDTPYVPSPIVYDGNLCFLKHYQGSLTCVEAASGATRFGPARLPGIENVYASLVGAAGRIYIVDRAGTTAVVRNGPTLEVLAQNQLDDSFSASPAIAGDELFLRGERYLYCLSATPARPLIGPGEARPRG